MADGRVEGIYVAAENGELPHAVERISALAGKGLEGNRYFWADGEAPAGNALTLVAAEALMESGLEITAAETRRNVLTSGIDVNALVGRRFRIGALECYGVELCEPCSHLQKITGQGRARDARAPGRPERGHPHRRRDRGRRLGNRYLG